MAAHAIAPQCTNLKPLSTPQNTIRVQGMQRILEKRRALIAALDEAIGYGFTEVEVDELYETEAMFFRNAREWTGSN